jgi:hypothetical protein
MLNYSPTLTQAKQSASTGTPWRLLILALVLFGLSILIWVGMEFGYKPYLNNQILQTDTKIEQLAESLKDGEEKDVVELYSQLYNIDALYKSHIYPSRVFSFIESVLLPSVRLTELDAEPRKNTITLLGVAPDMDTLTLQVATIQKNSNVLEVMLSSAKQQEKVSGISFVIRVDIKPGWLTGPQN